jgi:hypothetical protein
MATMSDKFDARTTRGPILRGLLRIETVVILLISAVMTVLCLLNLFWLPETWWLWLVLGLLGAVAMTWTASRDATPLTKSKAAALSLDDIDANSLRITELQAGVARALYQHRAITKLIASRTEDFAALQSGLSDWLFRVYMVADGLDKILQHPLVLEHFYSAMDVNEVKSAHMDSMAAFSSAASIVTANTMPEEVDEDYAKLILARDTVAQTRDSLGQTIDNIVSMNEVLRHARSLAMQPEHINRMHTMLLGEIETLGDAQRAVLKLGAAYGIRAN